MKRRNIFAAKILVVSISFSIIHPTYRFFNIKASGVEVDGKLKELVSAEKFDNLAFSSYLQERICAETRCVFRKTSKFMGASRIINYNSEDISSFIENFLKELKELLENREIKIENLGEILKAIFTNSIVAKNILEKQKYEGYGCDHEFLYEKKNCYFETQLFEGILNEEVSNFLDSIKISNQFLNYYLQRCKNLKSKNEVLDVEELVFKKIEEMILLEIKKENPSFQQDGFFPLQALKEYLKWKDYDEEKNYYNFLRLYLKIEENNPKEKEIIKKCIDDKRFAAINLFKEEDIENSGADVINSFKESLIRDNGKGFLERIYFNRFESIILRFKLPRDTFKKVFEKIRDLHKKNKKIDKNFLLEVIKFCEINDCRTDEKRTVISFFLRFKNINELNEHDALALLNFFGQSKDLKIEAKINKIFDNLIENKINSLAKDNENLSNNNKGEFDNLLEIIAYSLPERTKQDEFLLDICKKLAKLNSKDTSLGLRDPLEKRENRKKFIEKLGDIRLERFDERFLADKKLSLATKNTSDLDVFRNLFYEFLCNCNKNNTIKTPDDKTESLVGELFRVSFLDNKNYLKIESLLEEIEVFFEKFKKSENVSIVDEYLNKNNQIVIQNKLKNLEDSLNPSRLGHVFTGEHACSYPFAGTMFYGHLHAFRNILGLNLYNKNDAKKLQQLIEIIFNSKEVKPQRHIDEKTGETVSINRDVELSNSVKIRLCVGQDETFKTIFIL